MNNILFLYQSILLSLMSRCDSDVNKHHVTKPNQRLSVQLRVQLIMPSTVQGVITDQLFYTTLSTGEITVVCHTPSIPTRVSPSEGRQAVLGDVGEGVHDVCAQTRVDVRRLEPRIALSLPRPRRVVTHALVVVT